ncbi:MAG: hypothetical protein AAF556_02910, partial [Pseudomonadota bacterium]
MPDCPVITDGRLHNEICHGDLFCIQEIHTGTCIEFLAQKKPGGAPLGLLVQVYEEGLIGSGDQKYIQLDNDDLVRLFEFEFPDGPEAAWSASMSVMPQFGAPPAEPEDVVYLMPLPSNRGFRVLQASDRVKDHAGMLQNAVDFQ